MTSPSDQLFSPVPDADFGAAAGVNTQPPDRLDERPDAELAGHLFTR